MFKGQKSVNNEYEPKDCYFIDNTNIIYSNNVSNRKMTNKITINPNEKDKDGNSKGQDQIVVGGKSYVLNKNIYDVKAIDVKSDSAKVIIDGYDVWVFSKYLYEV